MLMALLHYAKPPAIEASESATRMAQIPSAPADAPEVLAVYLYLKALNSIFERGILTRNPVFRMNHPVMSGIKEGFDYFCTWIDSIEGEMYNHELIYLWY